MSRAGLVIASICLLLAGVSAADMSVIARAHGTPISWTDIIASTSPHWIVLALTLPLVLRLVLRWPPWPPSWRPIALQAAVFLTLTVVHAMVVAATVSITMPPIFGFEARLIRSWTGSMSIVVPLYGATLLTAWSLKQAHERRTRQLREARLELQLQAARLEALRAQLRPHFLFNTLNSISALVGNQQRDRATQALDQLAELLHASYRDDGSGLIPLGDEIALVGQYLSLQQLRFAERLEYAIAVTPDAARGLVPTLVLQPLVENAVIHGLPLGGGSMRLTIEASIRDEALIVTVTNDGRELPATWLPDRNRGVGLSNTRARLENLYGREAALVVRPRPGGGVQAELTIRRSPPQPGGAAARAEAAGIA